MLRTVESCYPIVSCPLQDRLKHATKPRGLIFRTKDEDIYLETSEDPFNERSSVSHLELGYRETDDMIMVKSDIPGQGIHDRASNTDWLTSSFGKNTLRILEAIGYKLNKKPSFGKSLGGFMAEIRQKPSLNLKSNSVKIPTTLGQENPSPSHTSTTNISRVSSQNPTSPHTPATNIQQGSGQKPVTIYKPSTNTHWGSGRKPKTSHRSAINNYCGSG
ncbi:hypothetical protein DSO57_1036353 [Entomophthora muscae]|uniref:Uncharacterized protein n=1 Tax=Entomophthora muscae TaxID=34485 RepID=A0ACC2TA95_9FUNG|nr:hypothetical protein DSO57_1036353 [Entomophthora muscae]